MLFIWKERFRKTLWSDVKAIFYHQWHGWCEYQADFSQFSSRIIGRRNPSNNEYLKNNFESSLIRRNLSAYAYCPGKALQPKKVPFRNGEDSQKTQRQLQQERFTDKMSWKKLWLFNKKEKPLQEVFFKEEILGRTKEKVFQEEEMEIPQEKSI